MATRNTINTNFWQIANANADGDITGITVAAANLGNVANVKITGGTNGQFLQTDGMGNLTFANASGGNGIGVPGGANTQIQYNNASAFGGIANFTYNNTNDTIAFSAANVSLGAVANLRITGGSNGQILTSNGAGGVSWSNVGATYSNANAQAYLASNSNIVITTTGNITTNASTTTRNFTANGNVVLGNVSNLFITGGANGQVLTVANASNGALGWATVTGGGGSIGNVSYGVENVQLITAPFNTYNFDVVSSAIKYATSNATTNVALNFRGNSTSTFNSLLNVGQSITCSYVMTTGSTPYRVTGVTIDGVAQTIRWVGGAPPSATSNSISTHTFTVIKTTATPTYTVLGSLTRYA